MTALNSAVLRRIAAELLGSALLAAVVVGSGIAAERLSPTDVGLQLLENALATALALPVLILLFIHVSGAHFNPVVSLVDSALGLRSWRDTAVYIPAQIIGCVAGAALANLMFAEAAVSWSTKERLTGATFLAEVVATAGLVLVIFALARTGRASVIPAAVGAYIGAAYFFTASTSFANPAITVGRMFSDSFAGIAPSSSLGFITAELIGGVVGLLLVRYFYPGSRVAGVPEPASTAR
ncbi:MAG TPA: MIP/aquaporin family protein [Homoserinimonas sp.]|nr:MIP/aquaporin family protein [Homoserinimonas sp.]